MFSKELAEGHHLVHCQKDGAMKNENEKKNRFTLTDEKLMNNKNFNYPSNDLT